MLGVDRQVLEKPQGMIEMNGRMPAWITAIAFLPPVLFADIDIVSAQSTDEIYRIGTDVGMEYLSEFSGKLRVTLLLQECNFLELASALGEQLPNTVQFFLKRRENLEWPSSTVLLAAQVTRAYVLGYETGVATEFQRETSAEKMQHTCSMTAAAAGQMLR